MRSTEPLHKFQSTHPVRGGTGCSMELRDVLQHFNPPTPCGVGLRKILGLSSVICISIHPPRAGWDGRAYHKPIDLRISIHPPRAGWDLEPFVPRHADGRFQSTHPVRGGTAAQYVGETTGRYFNPPTPCGVGREPGGLFQRPRGFQSTHPVRGGTASSSAFVRSYVFQSTHPVRGGTALMKRYAAGGSNFNPPTPCGVGRGGELRLSTFLRFQSTHPVRGGT